MWPYFAKASAGKQGYGAAPHYAKATWGLTNSNFSQSSKTLCKGGDKK